MQSKSQILDLLRRQSKPVSLKELLANLDPAPSDRSARRYLYQLIEQGEVEQIGKGRATKYRALTPSTPFADASRGAIERSRLPLYKRTPVGYREEWMRSYTPNETFYLSEKIRDQLQEAGERAHAHDPAGTYARQIFNRLLIDLSYNSSRLEGNTYSLIETRKLVLEGSSAEGKLDKEKVMILNHKEAILFLVDHAHDLTADEETVRTLHYLLADGLVDTHEAGNVRTHAVRIGGSAYLPLEQPSKIKETLSLLCSKAQAIQNPFEQAFFLLVHLSYLQAFTDVNKRCARLSANIPLIRQNLVPLAFNGIATPDYISAIITIYEEQNVGPLADLCVYSYLQTCIEYDSTIEALGFDEVRVRYRHQRRTLIRDIVLQLMLRAEASGYIEQRCKDTIPQGDRAAFIEDVEEDLDELGPHRIAGMGITPKELDAWLDLEQRD